MEDKDAHIAPKMTMTDEDPQSCPSEEARCYYCQEDGHPTGHRDCPQDKKEREILQFQEEHKVGRREAIASMHSSQDDPPSEEKRPTPFPTHFLITLKDNGASRTAPSINPFTMMKSLVQQLGGKPESVRRQGLKYLAHVVNSEQSAAIQEITHIDKHGVTVELHPSFNSTKRIIFTSNYTPTTDLGALKAGLKQDYEVTDVSLAKWIKPRNPCSKAYQITFPEG